MHDPLTVAHEIKNPFKRQVHRRDDGSVSWVYRPALITIWHKDPESDGGDDSCGWFSPPLTKRQKERVKHLAFDEARQPWFQAWAGKRIESPTEAETLMRAAFCVVARSLDVKITTDEATRWAIDLTHNPTDTGRSKLAFLPGYHSNFPDDRVQDREYEAESLFFMVARYILRERRPWYRHPRWHVYHWQLQVHPIQKFKRWAFSRCTECGGRFRWGYSPVSDNWYGTGPRWFRPEGGVKHSDCSRPASESVASANPADVAS
jgi:hypothetical protein